MGRDGDLISVSLVLFWASHKVKASLDRVQNRPGPLFLKEIDYWFGTAELKRQIYEAETAVGKQEAQ